MNSPTGEIHRRIFTLNGSNDADSRKDVPFGIFVDIAPYFGGKILKYIVNLTIPPKPQFLRCE